MTLFRKPHNNHEVPRSQKFVTPKEFWTSVSQPMSRDPKFDKKLTSIFLDIVIVNQHTTI